MDATQITILEKELELEKLQASVLQKELALLKAKGKGIAYDAGTSLAVKTEKPIVTEQPNIDFFI